MTRIYVFPGQGSQYKGMGESLFVRYPDLVKQADEILGYSIERLCLEDPDGLLNLTQYTQPALYVVNALSYLDQLGLEQQKPDFLAGHSLGEFNALFAAGAFDFATGLTLVQKRGELMSKAPKGAMAAVIDMDQHSISRLLDSSPFRKIQLANINSARQTIISGDYDEIQASEELFSSAGARFVRLNVSAAFHSSLMEPVKNEFSDFLENFQLLPLQIPVIANISARPYPLTGYKNYIVEQITGAVKWHESVSWLLQQSNPEILEVGPGEVLSKLVFKIRQEPFSFAAPQESTAQKDKKIIFMYSGQGSQYYQMGKELYEHNHVFKDHMNKCDAIVEQLTGISIVNELYNNINNKQQFDNIRITHPALFSVGYSLTKVLQDKGINPVGVLGYSLGEYVAAVVAGFISLEDGLGMVTTQANYLHDHGRSGGMLTILADISDVDAHPDMYADVSLAGINYQSNFVVSGEYNALKQLQEKLHDRDIISVMLPVAHGFHSNNIDGIEQSFRQSINTVPMKDALIPLYSSARKGIVNTTDPEYLWDVIRREVNFPQLIESLQKTGEYIFIDLSPTGTLSAFIKRSHGEKIKHFSAINQFGKNIQSLEKLLAELN